jgi:hypothetical protein
MGGQPRQSPAFQRFAEQPGIFWGAILACVGMGIGAVGTWATALGIISVAGTNGARLRGARAELHRDC